MRSEPHRLVGVKPWLPGFLGRSPWWNEPIRAERLAAMRIGLAAVLLADILLTYLPNVDRFFGLGSLGCPHALEMKQDYFRWNWSLLRGVEDVRIYQASLITWAIAAGGLFIGLLTRPCAIICWALGLSIRYVNYEADNAGGAIRDIGLFYLMLCPCGAVWSLDSGLQRLRLSSPDPGLPTFVHPWPVRLILIQLAVIYFFNGLHKLVSPQWQSGEVLYWVVANPMWGRWAYAEYSTPFALTQLATWITLAWELLFPLLILRPRTQALALLVGAVFHVGIFLSMELGAFPLYTMCLYLPFVPWERLTRK